MATNGSVLAEANEEDATQHSGVTARPTKPSPPKPEVARKPHLPGNKPRPPVPKKPPVAHKPPSPAHPPNHGNTAPVCTSPTSQPKNHNSDSTASSKLSTPDNLDKIGVTQNAGSGPKAGAKVPPPPLPKSPPKAAPPVARKGPPRPSHPPPPQRPAPPAPAKKPASKPALPPDKAEKGALETESSTALQKPTHSYDKVVVEENPKVVGEEKKKEGVENPASEKSASSVNEGVTPAVSAGEKRPTLSSYQQVVVEEHSEQSAAARHPSFSLRDGKSPPKHQPNRYENVDARHESKEPSQQASDSDPLRSYDQVIVEENCKAGPRTHTSVKTPQPSSEPENARAPLCEPESSEDCKGAKRPSVSPRTLPGDGEDKQGVTSVVDSSQEASKTAASESDCESKNLSTAIQAQCDGESSLDSRTDTADAPETKPQCSKSVQEPSETGLPVTKSPRAEGQPTTDTEATKSKACESVQKHLETGNRKEGAKSPSVCVRKSPRAAERPTRPAPAPPPVRPKPKKRISLLRQSVVSDDDSEPHHTPQAEEGSAESQSTVVSGSSQSATHDHVVGEALYQEIDELDHPDQKVTDSSSRGDGGSSLDASGVKGVCESQRKEHSQETKLAQENGDKSGGKSVCEKESETRGSNTTKSSTTTSSKSEPTDSDASVPNIDRSTKHSKGDSNQDVADSSRKSPEKEASTTIDDVEETSFMLKEIEQILKARLGSGSDETEETRESKSAEESDQSQPSGKTDGTPVRPPRPKRDKLRRQTFSSCSVDTSSTESLTSIGQAGKRPPPKPKRKHPPSSVTRSSSDITGMKSLVDNLSSPDEDKEKPFLPPRQESLRPNTDPKPPPLPPRNQSMDRSMDSAASSEGVGKDRSESVDRKPAADRRMSTPNAGCATGSPHPTKVTRSNSGARPGRKHVPRPTRKAPPPPNHPPSKPLTMAPQASSEPAKDSAAEKVPGYQKIINGSGPTTTNDINTVVPKTAVVGSINSPCAGEVTSDHDYHEIPDHLVPDQTAGDQTPSTKSKEETPPPDLPPRSYKPPAGKSSDPCKEKRKSSVSTGSEPDSSSTKLPVPEIHRQRTESEASSPQDKPHEELSSEDLTSQSSQMSSRPESFSSEVMGSLLHIVGDRNRPMSTHSSSSHSETGFAEGDVPTFDHSSGSESEGEPDEEKIRLKREKKVYFIAEEVVKSEKVFVDVLRLLNVDFRKFMSEKTEHAGSPIVPTETLNKILDFLPQLQSFNEMLLKDLTDRIAHWENEKKISDVFVKKGPFLKLYSSYIRNFSNATALLDESCKKHGSFGMALQQFEMSPRCANLALKHYMLKPIQRIPQYKLLLQDYLKHLTEDSPDYKDTITALSIVSEVADHANESMRHGDTVQKMLEIQRSLIGQFEVIMPGRVLIKQGELMKMSRKEMQPRMFFLFSDVLLYTTPTATGYRLNNILPLQGMKVLPPKLEEFKNEFNIMTTQRSFTVAASTPGEREKWLRALWNAIEENSERYHTFKAKQSEPKTSLLDKDFVLGSKAPLWVPDARVTMCMLCLAEFSITWRRHHCRACGRIICGNCSENKAPLRYLKYKPARVCDECFHKLREELDKLHDQEHRKSLTDDSVDSHSSTTAPTSPTSTTPPPTPDTMGLSFTSIKARFVQIRKSARERRKSGVARPSVLKEVHANDEGSDMSGYLWVAKNKKWKRLWFVVKGKVLYTYKASEDMAAIESMPLLGFEVTRLTSWYQGAEPDLMFELQHQNTQPLVFKPRTASSCSSGGGSERNSLADDSPGSPSPVKLSPLVKSSADTTTPRLVFRTDSAAATNKWLNVLREASLA
ncbi:uncharacterized protein [Littorina saxatilis]|uniref:uncharacterized protein n=1 Tax=Littorina saxatilis TaxID=31220 RepID=UPI0038B5B3BE